MPDLPTITVTQAQADRILAAYAARYGTTTTAATVLAYKKELAEHVRATVVNYEGDRITREDNIARADTLAALAAELPNPDTIT